MEQTKKKFKIGSLSPEEKLPNEQFSIKFTIFSNNTTYNLFIKIHRQIGAYKVTKLEESVCGQR